VIGADTAERLVLRRNIMAMTSARMPTRSTKSPIPGAAFCGRAHRRGGRVPRVERYRRARRYADLFTEIPEHRFRI